MDFREINSTNSREFDEAMAIYVQAFPANERHPVSTIGDRVRQGLNRLYVGSTNDEIAFLALLWPLQNTDFILLDYIATKDEHRGKGIASAFLKKLRTELLTLRSTLFWRLRTQISATTQKKRKSESRFTDARERRSWKVFVTSCHLSTEARQLR